MREAPLVVFAATNGLEDPQDPTRAEPDAEKQREECGEFLPGVSPVIDIGIELFPIQIQILVGVIAKIAVHTQDKAHPE